MTHRWKLHALAQLSKDIHHPLGYLDGTDIVEGIA